MSGNVSEENGSYLHSGWRKGHKLAWKKDIFYKQSVEYIYVLILKLQKAFQNMYKKSDSYKFCCIKQRSTHLQNQNVLNRFMSNGVICSCSCVIFYFSHLKQNWLQTSFFGSWSTSWYCTPCLSRMYLSWCALICCQYLSPEIYWCQR